MTTKNKTAKTKTATKTTAKTAPKTPAKAKTATKATKAKPVQAAPNSDQWVMARTKGAVSLVEVSLEELQRHFCASDKIVVGRKFLEKHNITEKASSDTIEDSKPVIEIIYHE